MSTGALIGLTLTEIVGDFGFSKFAQTGSQIGLAQGFAGYAGVIWFLIQCLKKANVMWVNGMWDGVSGLVETIAAYVILGNRLEGPQHIGIALIVAGLFFLKRGGGTGI